ncbi:E3 ubiquitin-protein ligase SHPRH-like [Macrosteles quadrilineatus]|uniref:E3 ubiquitin-protein ligase SHPRH-like n=1 Tax=Macrosteles quadrilineatus TaxID=74068 RepID=UPI0023E0E49E|nr:E3 ubiquitin-protein ligase SHPRH-like [Macrosteles quadrilineatus]
MLTTNRQRVIEIYDCVKQFHSLESFPGDLPDPQHPYLLPTLRPYQVKAVNWMLMKEIHPTYYERLDGNSSKSDAAILLPKGGILAEEMGLGKTVEVISCILSNPRQLDDAKERLKPCGINEERDIKKEVSEMEIVENDEKSTVEINSQSMQTENLNDVIGSRPIPQSSLEEMSKNLEDPHSKKENNEEQIKNRKKRGRKSTSIDLNLKSLKTDDGTASLKRVRFDIPEEVSKPSKTRKRKAEIEEVKSTVESVIDDVIVNYCYNGVAPKPKRRRQAAVKAEARTTKMVLQAWYEEKLAESSVGMRRTKRFQESSFQCCCVMDVYSDKVVECPKCETWQHCDCVGYDKDQADYEYCCFRCWTTLPPVPSCGTVIISPEAISQQWISEIEKHVDKEKKLKVLVYEGVRVNGYIQPHDLASYDIIVTTYEVLSKELNYTKPVSRSLRHAKRFFAPTSPLLFVEWWRLCLDEAQMVEGSSCRAAEMAKLFSAINKWAVTGTPIQKAVNDLVGLMEFLAGSQYPEFLALMHQDWRSLLRLVPRMLWRSQMKDVLAEVGVPPQTVVTHTLDFFKIEKYFYKCTHTECSQQFVNRISRFGDLNIPLKSLDRKLISSVLNPLLKLRQACLHPQAVRGKFVSFKKTMTMDDLVAQMVTNAKLDSEQALRQLVATLNGMGALHIILNQWADAVNAYRTVLHLEQEHSGRLKIDSLQRIHAMHNLAEVLDGGYEGVPPTLRDEKLREDVKALELRYLGKREAPITATEARVDSHAGNIAAHLDGATVGYSEWWLYTLEWTMDRDELLTRLKAAIQHTDVRQKNQSNNLANKLKSLYMVRLELAKWLADMDRVRLEVCNAMKGLRMADIDVMASEALCCHLPQAATMRNRTRCVLCKAESALNAYEALLFEERVIKKRINKRDLPGSENWSKYRELDIKEVSHLVDVNLNTFEINFKGGFKASPFERILKALATYARQKQAPTEYTKEAAQHLSLLEKIKKEFLDLNLLWRQICDLVDAKDELNMCKMRLRLPYAGEDEDKRTTGENHHIIQMYRVGPELAKLTTEKAVNEAQLKKKIGTLCYLETLQKEGAPAAICPVCRNDLTDKWSVLQCGHCLCLDCLSFIVKPTTFNLQCPQCRQSCLVSEISYVESNTDITTSAEVTETSPEQSKTDSAANNVKESTTNPSKTDSVANNSGQTTSESKSEISPDTTASVSIATTSQPDLQSSGANTSQPAPQSSGASTSTSVKGSYSTKVEAVVGRTLSLICQEPDVKILIFSAWEKMLDLLAEAFRENNITFRRMKASKVSRRQSIKEFKGEGVTALLLPLRSGGKGLNLVEATHVFLVEPILNPADELQAVGRVHRIGQTRPTTVHRFIVRETIEERIVAAVAASGTEQWADDCITLQQLFDLFSSDCELSINASQPDPSSSVLNVDSDSDHESNNEQEGLRLSDSEEE